jgi:autotransporter-associated beta strand protein
MTLAGGTWFSPDHWAVKQGSTVLTGPIEIQADTTFTGVRGTQVKIQGPLSGSKKLRVTSSDAYYNSAFVLSLEHASTHSGGVELLDGPYVTVKVTANRALGLGPVIVHSGALILEADQDYANADPATVTVGSQAAVWIETERVNLPLVVRGGRITTSAGDGGVRELAGNMTIAAAGATVSTARNRYLRISGTIGGPGALHTSKNDYYYQSTGCTWTTLSGKNNTYSGGTQIYPGGGLQVASDRALGTGPIEVHGAGIFPYQDGCLRGGLSIDVQQN